MKRKALIIVNPGEKGEENYCRGVFLDKVNFIQFFAKPVGGFWSDSEIQVMERPTRAEVLLAITDLKAFDYSLTVFSGHGWYSIPDSKTVLELRKGNEVTDTELSQGSHKQLIILDCCRKGYEIKVGMELMMRKFLKEQLRNPDRCRQLYNERISKCSDGCVITYSCDKNETSTDSSNAGGLYSSSLLDAADNWANSQNGSGVLSIVGAHNVAEKKVIDSYGGRQKPQITKPRSEPYFPFVVVA